MSWLPGVHVAPNIQGDPATYEIENRALDRRGLITAAMRAIRPWDGAVVADVGAGTGHWLKAFVSEATHAFAVEPHGPSRLLAHARVAREGWANASVLAGAVAQTNLATDSVDFVHVRFAGLWGPGGEAGVAELRRVVRPGGAIVVIDNDLRDGTFAGWLRRLEHQRDPDVVDGWWADHGFDAATAMSDWSFDSRADLEAVVRLELPSIAEAVLAEHEGTVVDCRFRLFSWRA